MAAVTPTPERVAESPTPPSEGAVADYGLDTLLQQYVAFASPRSIAPGAKTLLNPDEILYEQDKQRRGALFYEAMLVRSPKIRGLLRARVAAVTSLERSVVAGTPDDAQEVERAAFCGRVLARIPQFNRVLKKIVRDYIWQGRTFAEIEPEGRADGYYIKWIKPRAVDRFLWSFEDNFWRLRPSYMSLYDGETLDPRKWLVLANEATDEDPYGMPAAKSVFWKLRFIIDLERYGMVAADKFGMPNPMAEYDDKKYDDAYVTTTLIPRLKSMTRDSVGAFPTGITVKYLESVSRGQGAGIYGELWNLFQGEIAEFLTGHTAGNDTAKGGGIRIGTGDMQMMVQIRQDLLEDDAEALYTNLITDQLLRRIYLWNFGEPPDGEYPKMEAKTKPPADATARADVLTKAQGMGFPLSLETVSDELQLAPPKDAGTTILEPRAAAAPWGAGPIGGDPAPGRKFAKQPLAQQEAERETLQASAPDALTVALAELGQGWADLLPR